jgi:protein AaeX
MIPEIDIDGIFLSTLVPTAIAALFLTWCVRKLLGAAGAYRFIWHPALFDAALFLILWAVVIALPVKV